jgi:hypothetical protein
MNLQEWEKEYVESNETPQEVLKHMVIQALICAKRHHLECVMGEGTEASKPYNDLLNMLYGDEVQIDFN